MSRGRGDDYCRSPVDFSFHIQTCSANIQKITHNTAQIKLLLDHVGTKQDISEAQDRLHKLQQNSNQLAKETSGHMKDLSSLPRAVSSSEQRQQKIQMERLRNNFTVALNSLQAEQRRAARLGKESVARARAASRLSKEGSSHKEQLETAEHQDAWGQTAAQTQETSITEEDLALIEEREMSLRKLESDIRDLNDIFKDVALMVHDQGDMIDSIEANVESTQVHVEKGVGQLQKASQCQHKSRKKTCILILVLLLVVMVLAVVLSTAS